MAQMQEVAKSCMVRYRVAGHEAGSRARRQKATQDKERNMAKSEYSSVELQGETKNTK